MPEILVMPPVIIPLLVCLLISCAFVRAEDWPQFRGPAGASISAQARPPVQFGAETNLLWRIPFPGGNSSPCVVGERVFLTAQTEGKLETVCVRRSDGKILWQRPAPAEKLEAAHRLGSPATPTPASDGERVYVYFGSFGLLCYDLNGAEQWYKRLPAPVVEFGTSSSPLLAGHLLILNRDQDTDSQLLAVDKRTGKTIWQTDRSEFRRGFATPLIWRHDGTEELIVPGSLWLKSYDLPTGRERWRSRGFSRVATSSPAVGGGLLFVSSWNIGGDPGERITMPPFAEVVKEFDKNHDGRLTRDELPKGPILERFSQMDVDKDGAVTAAEWDGMAEMFAQAENALVAIKPGGHGDISSTHLAWKQTRSLPYVSSPLFYGGRLYTIKNGGLASCYEAATGRVLYQDERLGAPGDYYASAVAADGRVYAVSQAGIVTVIKAGDALEILARNNLGESILATPALVANQLFIRSAKQLWAFENKN